MTLWDFLSVHPWWGLLYLALCSITACEAAYYLRRGRP